MISIIDSYSLWIKSWKLSIIYNWSKSRVKWWHSQTIIKYNQIYCFSALFVFTKIWHYFVRKPNNSFALLIRSDSFLTDSSLLKIITMNKYITLISIHYDKAIIFCFIEKLQSSCISFIFIYLESAVLPSDWIFAGRHRSWSYIVKVVITIVSISTLSLNYQNVIPSDKRKGSIFVKSNRHNTYLAGFEFVLDQENES